MTLTESQKKTLNFYKDRNNWKPPPYKEIMLATGLRSKNAVSKHLKKLRELNLI